MSEKVPTRIQRDDFRRVILKKLKHASAFQFEAILKKVGMNTRIRMENLLFKK